MGVFSIRSEYSKYGEYHSNKVNVAIHMVFVPTILWTSLALFTAYFPGPLFTFPAPILSVLQRIPGPMLSANVATLTMTGYIVFYMILDQIAGLLITPVIYLMLITSQQYVLSSPNAVSVSLFWFVFAWIAQFVGHGVFERRAPALLDNLLQALVMAPFFVFLEILFALGYRPALHREVRNEIGSRILAFRRKTKQTTNIK
ncbi:DUF962-domain-containing protein [Coemansia reversa NRRL 1564]|uniref:DUF962-domain-containing protein n=2 Tax=Coemansia reversa (strain ATCC 12441 / NRRL 1564) TaxID=763665 RepID=A0A2G5BDU5_COERN|nr:DUF962-domain-containing protein [Coemansia reversa NRRL 1564]|eukprot:PIA17186.1 DUF962-domain-containing protein [Coemansia reversa NRRL 1564]